MLNEATLARPRWMDAAPGNRRGVLLVVAVAVCYAIVVVITTLRIGFGADEAVYLSQYAHGVPRLAFTAPRSRGLPVMIYPIAALTTSVTAIRCYMAVLGTAGLFLAYLPWTRVRIGTRAAAAAALFGAQWLTLFYGAEVMPNLYVAYGSVAAVGMFALAADRWSPRRAAGLIAAVGFTALIRPFDATWLAAALVVAIVVRRGWRRLRLAVAVAAGLAIGWAEWGAEAFAYYGGPLHRLHLASGENVAGMHFTLIEQLRALNGPLQCRPPHHCGPVTMLDIAWCAAMAALIVFALYATRRMRGHAELVLTVWVAAVMGMSYLLLIGYAAPRFLIPVYALAAVPVAAGLQELWRPRTRERRGVRRGAAMAVVLVVVAGYGAVQGDRLVPYANASVAHRHTDMRVARAVSKAGVRPPCLLFGKASTASIGFYARCSSVGRSSPWRHRDRPTHRIRAAIAAGRHFGIVVHGNRRPAPFLDAWRRIPLPGVRDPRGPWYLYVPPNGGTGRPR